jgi:hypothetical protein
MPVRSDFPGAVPVSPVRPASPEAVDALRGARCRARKVLRTGVPVTICTADPLNLTGIVLPGVRIRENLDATQGSDSGWRVSQSATRLGPGGRNMPGACARLPTVTGHAARNQIHRGSDLSLCETRNELPLGENQSAGSQSGSQQTGTRTYGRDERSIVRDADADCRS